MRVLHVLNSLEGGATVSVRELVRASVRAETDMRHFAVFPGAPGGEAPALDMFDAVRAVPLAQWNRPRGIGALRTVAAAVLRARRRLLGPSGVAGIARAVADWRIDLVTTNCAANLDGALAAQLADVPHLWHIRERIGSDGSLHFRLTDAALARRIAGLSVRIAAVSRYAAEPFDRAGAGGKVRIVHDGIDPAPFASVPAAERGRELRRRWLGDGEGPLVGAVANLTAQVKRHDLLLRAAALLAGRRTALRFVIVGKIPDSGSWFARSDRERWKELRRMAEQLDLGDRLVWAGAMDDIPAVMNAFDILFHACEIEGLGRVVLEAMAAGRPVVAPAAGGVDEAAKKGVTGILVTPRSARALAAGAETLISDPGLRHRMGAAGRARVESHFTLQRHLDIMVDLYRECACERAVDTVKRALPREVKILC